MKAEIEELITLEKDLSGIRYILPFAFSFSGLLWLVASLMGRQEHNYYYYILAALGVWLYIVEIIARKRCKIRIKELRGKL